MKRRLKTADDRNGRKKSNNPEKKGREKGERNDGCFKNADSSVVMREGGVRKIVKKTKGKEEAILLLALGSFSREVSSKEEKIHPHSTSPLFVCRGE